MSRSQTGWWPNTSTGVVAEAPSSSSHATCSAGSAPPTWPGAVVSSTASVTPGSSHGVRSTLDGQRRIVHRVVVAAHVPHARPELSEGGEERLVLLGEPAVGEITLDHDRVGIEPRDLGDRAAAHHLGVRRFAGIGAQDRADGVGRGIAGEPALRLSEVDVVRGGDRRDQLARRLRERAHTRRQPVVGRHTFDGERRTRCRATRSSIRATWYGPIVVTSRSPTRVRDRRDRVRS